MFSTRHSGWMEVTLWGAAIYGLASGVLILADPSLPPRLLGIDQPFSADWWRFMGAVAITCGLGYMIASSNPYRHWPMVLVGLFLKILPLVWFVKAASAGLVQWRAGWTTLVNDVIWWVPLGLILKGAFAAHVGNKRLVAPEVQRMALRSRTQLGATIGELSRTSPLLMVFLRHSGCPFCREALSDLSRQRHAIELTQTRIVLVHMGSGQHGQRFFRRYRLEDLPRVSDPKRSLYRAFGLGRGGFITLLGPRVWLRAVHAGVIQGHGVGRVVGDGFQMPGVVLVYQGEVIRSYHHQSTADRPDYLKLAADDQLPCPTAGFGNS